MSKAERLLSYSLLSLITTKPIATLPNAGVVTREEDTYSQSDLDEIANDEEDQPAKKVNGYVHLDKECGVGVKAVKVVGF